MDNELTPYIIYRHYFYGMGFANVETINDVAVVYDLRNHICKAVVVRFFSSNGCVYYNTIEEFKLQYPNIKIKTL